ncbi:MAG: hypothetical protein WCX28_00155 [Bacteriovoracaceae bacterium]|nr:hypothetical protein [Bacteroidota bacterium]
MIVANHRRTIFLLAFLSLPIAAQQQELIDTNLTILRLPDPGILLDKPAFTLPLSFAVAPVSENHQLPLYLSFTGTPQSFAWEQTQKTDLTAPLKLQLYMSNPEKFFQISISAASTAGAMYIAYKRLKKYGLK